MSALNHGCELRVRSPPTGGMPGRHLMGERRVGAPPAGGEEQFAALGRVMSELVHDLSNELTVLHGWSLLARGEQEAGRMGSEETERVVALSAELGQMLRDVVEVIGGQTLSPEVAFAPAAVAEEVVAKRVQQLSDRLVRLRSQVPEGVMVRGRTSFLARAVANLVGNAARHARCEVLVALHVEGAGGGGREVVMRVEDDGMGVPPSDRAAVFEPLWKGSQGRTGLGLSSARWAVEQLGGTIEYRDDSALGGAAFEIRLPVASPLAAAVPLPAGILEALQGRSIVLVDDDTTVRGALARLLSRHGARATQVNPVGVDPELVLAAVASAGADVVLMDLRLGEHSGVDLWGRMCMEMPHLAARVVFASGAAPGDPEWDAAQRTGQPLLAKPFEVAHLAEVVQRLRLPG